MDRLSRAIRRLLWSIGLDLPRYVPVCCERGGGLIVLRPGIEPREPRFRLTGARGEVIELLPQERVAELRS